MNQSYTLLDENSQTFFYNLKEAPIQRMLDFDALCGRATPSVAAIIHPGKKGNHKVFFGTKEILIPIYSTLNEAVAVHPHVESFINFSSHRSAYNSTKEVLDVPSIKVITIVAEDVPERQTKELIALAKEKGKILLGPATVGGIVAGKFRIGHAAGMVENVLAAKLYKQGSVGLVSKSGAMMNELFHIINRSTNGICEGMCIGGDTFPGSTLLDHLLRYEKNPAIRIMVALGEIGGSQEYEIIEAKKQGKLTKPLVMWVCGTCAKIFPWKIQFGHAGAKAGKVEETAIAKNETLRAAGVIVPNSFEDFEDTIKKEFLKLNISEPSTDEKPKTVPLDFNEALKEGIVRRATQFTSTISSDKGEEPTYCQVPMSKLLEDKASLGKVIGLLWFKKDLPDFFTKFLDMCLVLCADHGPAVSGAHNAMVASRAGKDVISSLCSGLLTIGPRFGGALDDACRYFKKAYDEKKQPFDFVDEMKKQGILIPGIGHRVKSIRNPDKRVELLKKYAAEHFPSTQYLQYALEVEKVTTKKAENLILNVDGCIAALFLDALVSSKLFTVDEINEIIEIGYLNGLFALARSVGLIGHILDQKRLGEGLYRHPTEDIFYV